MAAWADERLALFEHELTEYPAAFIFGGITFSCIADSIENMKEMSQVAYIGRRPLKFSMRQSDFNSSGIALRSTIAANGFSFEVISISIDDVDPIVEIKANMKQ